MITKAILNTLSFDNGFGHELTIAMAQQLDRIDVVYEASIDHFDLIGRVRCPGVEEYYQFLAMDPGDDGLVLLVAPGVLDEVQDADEQEKAAWRKAVGEWHGNLPLIVLVG